VSERISQSTLPNDFHFTIKEIKLWTVLDIHRTRHCSTYIHIDNIHPMMLQSMKYYTTSLLAVTMFFLCADQNLLAPNLSQIAKEFHFNDHQRDVYLGGYIAFGFFIVGGPMALLVGYFTDVCHRCRLFGLVVVFSSCASLSTYWVRSYPELLICRILTGVGIGGATPVIFSLLGDLYPGSSRVHVSTTIGLAMAAGVASGQLVAGTVGPLWGWRTPFLFVAVPAATCALLVCFTVDEPVRGEQELAVRLWREKQRNQTPLSKPPAPLPRSLSWTMTTTATPLPVSSSSREAYGVVALISEEDLGDNSVDNDELHCNRQQLQIEEQVLQGDYQETVNWVKVMTLLRTRSAALIFLQGLPGCLPWGMLIVFLNDFLSSDRGMTIQVSDSATV
jgi:MFS family permease